MSAVVIPIVPAIALKRLLFTTDFSDVSQRALPVVSAIARRYGSKVFAAHVWTPGSYPLVSFEAAAVLDRKRERAAKTELERICKAPLLSGIKMELIVRRGNPAQEISHLVDQHNISLAVMSTHGTTGFKHRVLGSVAEDAIRSLPCPVLTVGPRLSGRFTKLEKLKNILFPTDFSPESMAVFPYLASIAHEYESRLTILHVLSSAMGQNQKAVADRLQEQMERTLTREISPRCCANFVVVPGAPAETILAQAHALDADLIGLGVRACTDIAKQFRETVAYRILSEAECPVLTHNRP